MIAALDNPYAIEPSGGYVDTLNDLNLLPEVVADDPDARRCMLACYFGYRVGKDAAEPAKGTTR